MAEVLVGSIKHDGEVFEVGSPASKLPKSVREMARNNGLLGPAPKKVKKPKEAEEPEVVEDETEDETEDEPGVEE